MENSTIQITVFVFYMHIFTSIYIYLIFSFLNSIISIILSFYIISFNTIILYIIITLNKIKNNSASYDMILNYLFYSRLCYQTIKGKFIYCIVNVLIFYKICKYCKLNTDTDTKIQALLNRIVQSIILIWTSHPSTI